MNVEAGFGRGVPVPRGVVAAIQVGEGNVRDVVVDKLSELHDHHGGRGGGTVLIVPQCVGNRSENG